jgi:DNA/RNA-binding domain of Phe-tRNA-synthetase-like protein
MQLVIEDAVRETYDISVGIAELKGLRPKEKESRAISNEIADVEAEIKSTYRIDEVKEIRTIRLQRDFFWRMGIDPTKVRPASEALLRRILLHKGLPRVSPVVDAYNLASVKTLITFSAFDHARIAPPLSVRFSRKGEAVTLIGHRRKELTGKEIVLTDSAKVLCVYVHGDVEETKVTNSTKDVLLVAYGIPGMSKEEVKRGVLMASNYIKRFAGGEGV